MTQNQHIDLWANMLVEAVMPEDIENAKATISEYAKRALAGDEITDEEFDELKTTIQTALSDKKTKPTSPLAIDIINIAIARMVPVGLKKFVY